MHSNIEKLEQAVKLLEELADDVVFVGGCATGILITDPAAPTVRGTIDVDVIANVDKLSERIGGRATLDCSLTTYSSVKDVIANVDKLSERIGNWGSGHARLFINNVL